MELNRLPTTTTVHHLCLISFDSNPLPWHNIKYTWPSIKSQNTVHRYLLLLIFIRIALITVENYFTNNIIKTLIKFIPRSAMHRINLLQFHLHSLIHTINPTLPRTSLTTTHLWTARSSPSTKDSGNQYPTALICGSFFAFPRPPGPIRSSRCHPQSSQTGSLIGYWLT